MGKGVNVPTLNARFLAMRPSGYLTPEDEAFGGRLLGTANEMIGSSARQRLGQSAARLAQRGLGGAVAEQAFGDIGGQADVARAGAATGVSNILSDIYQGNRKFEQGKVMTAWQAELAAKERSDRRRQAQQAGWWNALSGGVSSLAGMLTGGVAGLASSEGWNNPDTADLWSGVTSQ